MKEEIYKLEQLKLKLLKYKIFYYQMCLEERVELSINYIKNKYYGRNKIFLQKGERLNKKW